MNDKKYDANSDVLEQNDLIILEKTNLKEESNKKIEEYENLKLSNNEKEKHSEYAEV